jgi:hypothetical protein
MRRATITVALIATFAAALWVFAAEIPENITIDAAMNKKSAVEFPHAAHVETGVSCDTCHHTLEGLTAERAAEVKKCSACHLDPTEEGVPSMREMSPSKNPLHKGCINCHKTEAKGPIKCNDCHPKAE